MVNCFWVHFCAHPLRACPSLHSPGEAAGGHPCLPAVSHHRWLQCRSRQARNHAIQRYHRGPREGLRCLHPSDRFEAAAALLHPVAEPPKLVLDGEADGVRPGRAGSPSPMNRTPTGLRTRMKRMACSTGGIVPPDRLSTRPPHRWCTQRIRRSSRSNGGARRIESPVVPPKGSRPNRSR